MKYLIRPTFGSLLIVAVMLAFVIPMALFSVRAHQTDAASPLHHARPLTGTPVDWPEFHADAARDGSQSSNAQLNLSNASTLVPITGPAYTTTGSVNSSPAIVAGVLYYAADIANAPDASTMYAVSVATGQVLWSVPFPACGSMPQQAFVMSSPAVTTGYISSLGTTETEVFIGRGSRNKGGVGCIYDFDGTTGNLIWDYSTPGADFASPAIMATNNGNIVVAGDNSDYVHAYSVNYAGPIGGTGVQLWQYNTRYDPAPPGSSQYCQKNEELCGDAVWSSPAEAMVMVNGTSHHYAYFGVGAEANTVGRVDAIDLDVSSNAANSSAPALAWAFWDPAPLFNDDFGTILALTDSNGFGIRIYSGMNNGHLFALDPATGSMLFDFDTSAQLGGIKSVIHSTGSLAVINGVTELIFGSGSKTGGYIWAIDALSTASGGTLLWMSQNFGGEMLASPAVVNQGADTVVYTMGSVRLGTPTTGDLLAIDPSNGSVLADYPVYNHAYSSDSSPAVYGNMVFVTEGNNIYNNPEPGKGGLAAFQCATC